ncbi:MAG TPA: CbiM family transporter [Gemmataceae bacterium]|nr:CbiM family transporter [Gemmataceae bacterium]
MTGMLIHPLLAVHISDGVLAPSWLLGGFVVAALLACFGAWKIRDEEIPRVAVLTSAFFVASLVHVRVPPTSVHLILNGLMGVVLGRRAALAIPVGLFLQAALIGHGGFTSLGINSCVMVLPALLAWQLFGFLRLVPWATQLWFRGGLVTISALTWILSLVYVIALLWGEASADSTASAGQRAGAWTWPPLIVLGALVVAGLAAWIERRLENAPEFPLGLLVGEITVLATVLLNSLVLAWGGVEDWRALAEWIFIAHLPIAVVEGVVLGFTIGFLARVKPEMLGSTKAEEVSCAVDAVQ